jgi:hypothetical protein
LKGDKWSAQMIGPGDILSVGTSFPIKMTDFGIQVPKLLVLKVAAEVQINVRVNARTQPMPAGR